MKLSNKCHIVSLISLLVISAWLIGGVCLEGGPRLNYIAVGISFLMIAIASFLPLIRNFKIKKIVSWNSLLHSFIVFGSFGCFIIWLFVVSFLSPEVLTSNKDFSFEHLRTELVHEKNFAIYRTNGGATTGFGIVVRQEKRIIPGLKWVDVVFSHAGSDVSIMTHSNKEVEFIPLDE